LASVRLWLVAHHGKNEQCDRRSGDHPYDE
jgi:hypothetical protein